MKRLIDDMTPEEIYDYYLRDESGESSLISALKKLCAPIPDWRDGLGANDSDTWVLCFTSDSSPQGSNHAQWVLAYNPDALYPYQCWGRNESKYATPVDLAVRYKVN